MTSNCRSPVATLADLSTCGAAGSDGAGWTAQVLAGQSEMHHVPNAALRGGLAIGVVLMVLAFMLLMVITSVVRRALTFVMRVLTVTADFSRLVTTVIVGIVVVNALFMIMVEMAQHRQ